MSIHIGRDGTPKRCRAKKACPFGGANLHFDDLNSAQAVADSLNSQLASLNGLGFAKEGDFIKPSAQTELAVVKLYNMKLAMKKLDSVRTQARNNIIEELKSNNIKTLDSSIGKFTHVSGSERTVADVDKLQEAGEYENYLKESRVSEHTRLDAEKDSKLEAFERKITQTNGNSIDFRISKDSAGNVVLSEDAEKALLKLKEFEEKLERAKQLEKEIKTALMEEMKQAEVNKIKVGNAKFEYVPEHTRNIVDTKKLKDSGEFNNFSKKVKSKDSLRVKFS